MLGKYTKEDGKILLKLARQSIESEFTGIKPELPQKAQFKQARGVFVTLTENNELKGCIGIPEPVYPLYKAVVEAAKSAAFSDPRFLQLTKEELDKINIEISILSQIEDVKDIKEIEIGKHGLISHYLGYSGLLLPQVATENKMNKIQFLEALCQKSGLPKNSWQKSSFKLKKFTCEIFSEKDL